MNRKILIASIFATLILLVPMTSVVGVSDVEDDCGCEDVNRYDLFRVKLLLVRLKVYINIILLRFGFIPEVAEKCEEILDVIKSDETWHPICDILEDYMFSVLDWRDTHFEPGSPLWWIITLHLINLAVIYAIFCQWPPPP
jgi:hypothetical protein